MPACDDFEIMFNRPGGVLAEDIVPSYIFGAVADCPGNKTITTIMWGALAEIWTEFSLSDHNNRGRRINTAWPFARRAWFYTGGGLPLKSDGSLATDGRMFARVVAPIIPSGYKNDILVKWSDTDGRYRCLFLDAAAQVAPSFFNLCHDAGINEAYTLVGESIPPDVPARLGAAWFARLEASRSPWWVLDNEGTPDRDLGYNTLWSVNWLETPTYFGVQDSSYPYLRPAPSQPPPSGWTVGPGSNMSMSDVYRWIVRGAAPIAWPNTYRRIGCAWNYATARIPRNKWDRVGRHSRVRR